MTYEEKFISTCVEEWKDRVKEHQNKGDDKGASYYRGKIDGVNWVLATLQLEEEFR